MRKNNKGASSKLTVAIVLGVVLVIGIVGFFMTKSKTQKAIEDTDSYKIHNYKYSINTSYAIRVPNIFEDKTKNYIAGPNVEKMLFLGCDDAAVAVGRTNIGTDEITQEQINTILKSMSFEGQTVEPEQHGDFSIFSFSSDNVKVLGDREKKAFVMIGYMFDGTYMYEITAWCYDEDKDDYEEYMIKWITSFHLFK